MGFLTGKRALIVGVASARSIAHGIAKAMHREGAELARSAEDIIEVVRPIAAKEPVAVQRVSTPSVQQPKPLPVSLTQHVQPKTSRVTAEDDLPDILFSMLGPAPTSVDDLVRESGEAASKVQAALLELELAGRIERGAGGVVSIV